MLIQSLKTHFTARRTEWIGAGLMTTWGYYYITHPQLITDPKSAPMFTGMVEVCAFFAQPPVAVGVMALLTGVIRACALLVNGAYENTPLMRLVTAFASAYLWTSITIGFWMAGIANTGLAVYPWLAIMDIISAYSAGYDLVIAENNARKMRTLHGHHSGTERGFVRRVRRLIFPGSFTYGS